MPHGHGRTTLFVAGIGSRTRARDLAFEFERYGRLVRCDIPAPRNYNARPYAFVEFEDYRDAEEAYREMDNRRVDGYALSIQWAKNAPSRTWRYERSRSRSRSPRRVGGDRRMRSRSPRSDRRRSRSRSPRTDRRRTLSPKVNDVPPPQDDERNGEDRNGRPDDERSPQNNHGDERDRSPSPRRDIDDEGRRRDDDDDDDRRSRSRSRDGSD